MEIIETRPRTALADRLRSRPVLLIVLSAAALAVLIWWAAARNDPPVDARSLQLSVSLGAVDPGELIAAQTAMAGPGGVAARYCRSQR